MNVQIFVLKFLLFFMTILMSQKIYSCEHKTSKKEIAGIIKNVTKHYFPELINANLAIREFKSEAYFLQARPEVSSLAGKKNKRKYYIEVNTELYKCSPETHALESIIAHELEHVNDYHRMSALQIAQLAGKYSFKNKRANYERATDTKVIEKGLGSGLIDYRLWIYGQLSPKELELKKFYYLTPEEILDMM